MAKILKLRLNNVAIASMNAALIVKQKLLRVELISSRSPLGALGF